MQKQTPVGWAETTTIYSRNIQWIRTAYVNNQDEKIKRYLYNTLYRLQHVYKQMQDNNIQDKTLWNTLCTDLNKCSYDWRSETGRKRTLHCARPDSAKCTVVWTWTKYSNWTRVSFPSSFRADLCKWIGLMKVTNSTKAFNN